MRHTSTDRKVRGRQNRAQGDIAEKIVRMHLRQMGLRRIERVHTGWGVIRKGSKIVGAYPQTKVEGDWRAVAPGGRSVLVEAKSRSGRLCWSDLEKHQIEALNGHHEAGGLSLLAFVNTDDMSCRIFQWPIPDFGPRKSIQ